MKKRTLQIADVCGIIALILSLVLAIGGLFTYAHELRANQEVILEKLEQIEIATNTRKLQSDED